MNSLGACHGVLVDKMHKVAGAALVLMMFFTAVDVAMRYMGKPILGSYDLIPVVGLIAMAFGLPHTTRFKHHVFVDMLTGRLPATGTKVVNLCTGILSIGLFCLLAFGSIVKGWEFAVKGEVSQTIHLPLFAVIFVFSGCCLVQCLTLVVSLVDYMKRGAENG